MADCHFSFGKLRCAVADGFSSTLDIRDMQTNLRMLIVVAALLRTSLDATACSSPGHHTNDELIRDAEAIVLVKVVGGTLEHFENPNWPSIEMTQFHDGVGPGAQVTFEPIRTLKGAPLATRFELLGSLKYFGSNKESVPYKLARPGAQRGMCFAYDYKLSGTFLLFLKNGSPYWSAVRPTNEEVFGPRDKWLAWVESRIRQLSRRPAEPRGEKVK